MPRLAGYLTAFIGLIDLASALTRPFHRRLMELTTVVPGALTRSAAAATVVTGLLLLMLAKGLRRRKHRAWQAATLLLLVSVVFHIVKGLDYEEASVAVLLLALLVYYRSDFYAVGDPRTRWSAVSAFLGLFVVNTFVGWLLIVTHKSGLVGSHSTWQMLSEVWLGMVGINGPLGFVHEQFQDIVSDFTLALGIMLAVVTAYLALRTPEPPGFLPLEDETRLRELLAKQGARDSLGYFALRRDKSVIWSASGKAAVAYRVVSGVMLASGDPIGDPEAWPGAIRRFLEEADRHAWVPAVMGCSEAGGEVWCRESGMDALELGDEAVVEVCDFSLQGRQMRNVRQMVSRVERAGYSTEVRRVGDISEQERTRMRSQTQSWRGTETERGFSMALGRFGDPADADCVAVMAFKDDTLRALLHFVPWGSDGLSLDLMVRDRTADAGLNEMLITSALKAAPEMGIARVSLNFAVFRSAMERGGKLGAGPVLRLWRSFLVFVSRWFQIESLYRFNAKFSPDWEPRFVCYPTVRDVPRIAIAALEAEAFIVWPRPRLRFVRRLVGSGSA
ncbi:phosphatidylglycerol lysyltransferase domain-containing protein [Acidothermaceae bacterium B102]|nr:phosphatidylglycerol lysyltransferase domain-containing protein [Acidothermaceae bacterium B102]